MSCSAQHARKRLRGAVHSDAVSREGKPPFVLQPIGQMMRDEFGGAEGIRTPDLCSAIAALSHLSYSPGPFGRRA